MMDMEIDKKRSNTKSFESKRLVMRSWQEDDAEQLYKMASETIVGARAGWPPHRSVDESLEIIRTVFNNPSTWAITLKSTGSVVGAMGYGPSCDCALPRLNGEPIVGYWVGKKYWGQGFCTEALAAMIEYVKENTNITSFISGHFIDNPASGRVMEKCGFIPTGETTVDESLYAGKNRPIRILRLKVK